MAVQRTRLIKDILALLMRTKSLFVSNVIRRLVLNAKELNSLISVFPVLMDTI